MLKDTALPNLLGAEDRRWFCCGSLPFSTPQAAMDFIGRHPEILPFAPEIKTSHEQSGMLPRAIRACASNWSGYSREEFPGLYEHAAALGRKKGPALYKSQLCGPLTLSAYGLSSDPRAFESGLEKAIEATARQIEWQVQFAGSVLPAKLMLVLDEPVLANWPLFSPAQKTKIKECYSLLYVRMAEAKVFAGLHSCAPLEIELLELPLDLYSFDAGAGAPLSHPLRQAVLEALRRGLVLAPGTFQAAPQARYTEEIDAGLRRFEDFQAIGARAETAAGIGENTGCRLLMSANCGHSGATIEWVNELYGAGERQSVTVQ